MGLLVQVGGSSEAGGAGKGAAQDQQGNQPPGRKPVLLALVKGPAAFAAAGIAFPILSSALVAFHLI